MLIEQPEAPTADLIYKPIQLVLRGIDLPVSPSLKQSPSLFRVTAGNKVAPVKENNESVYSWLVPSPFLTFIFWATFLNTEDSTICDMFNEIRHYGSLNHRISCRVFEYTTQLPTSTVERQGVTVLMHSPLIFGKRYVHHCKKNEVHFRC